MRSEQEANRAIERYADTVRRICMIHLKNHADTEDIFQNVFLKYVLSVRMILQMNDTYSPDSIRVLLNRPVCLFFTAHIHSSSVICNGLHDIRRHCRRDVPDRSFRFRNYRTLRHCPHLHNSCPGRSRLHYIRSCRRLRRYLRPRSTFPACIRSDLYRMYSYRSRCNNMRCFCDVPARVLLRMRFPQLPLIMPQIKYLQIISS